MELPARLANAHRWRVLIVEDDPTVAQLHRQVVDALPHFRTVQTVSSGEAAYASLEASSPDLVILDLTMPGGDGLTFLQRVRTESISLEAIVVTASRDAKTVRESMHLGVLDYLVKPFALERLREALVAFARREQTLRRPWLGQKDVDVIQSTGESARLRLPKGLRRLTLRLVLETLGESSEALTADEVGKRVGIARVTARRYLEYLDVIGRVELLREHHGAGRPRNRYRRLSEDARERRTFSAT